MKHTRLFLLSHDVVRPAQYRAEIQFLLNEQNSQSLPVFRRSTDLQLRCNYLIPAALIAFRKAFKISLKSELTRAAFPNGAESAIHKEHNLMNASPYAIKFSCRWTKKFSISALPESCYVNGTSVVRFKVGRGGFYFQCFESSWLGWHEIYEELSFWNIQVTFFSFFSENSFLAFFLQNFFIKNLLFTKFFTENFTDKVDASFSISSSCLQKIISFESWTGFGSFWRSSIKFLAWTYAEKHNL